MDDFNDCVIIVDPFADGQVEGGFTWGSFTVYSFQLLDPDGQVVIDLKGRPCNPFQRGQLWEFSGSGRCSYGMNVAVERFNLSQDGNKILLVEYGKLVARVVDPYPTDLMGGGWPHWVRPRHGDVLNVLFCDGHVETMNPDAIDPSILKLQHHYWRPATEQRFLQ